MIRVALDTNVLVYAEGVERSSADAAKVARARLIAAAANRLFAPVLPLQVLAELHEVLVHKAGFSAPDAAERVRDWSHSGTTVATDAAVFDAAIRLAGRHRLRTYDAIIVAAAARAHCDLLLSEDLQDGFAWSGVTVANPFSADPHPDIAAWLG